MTQRCRFPLALPPIWLLLFAPMAALASMVLKIGWMLRKPDDSDQGADPPG